MCFDPVSEWRFFNPAAHGVWVDQVLSESDLSPVALDSFNFTCQLTVTAGSRFTGFEEPQKMLTRNGLEGGYKNDHEPPPRPQKIPQVGPVADFDPPQAEDVGAMAADMAEAPLAIGDFEDGILVSFMNALSLPTLAELEAKGLFPAAGIRLYQYATVDRFSSLPLRTTEIGVFSVDEIKRATLELWRDYGTGRQIDVYLVVPQPDEHVLSGLTFVIDIFHFDYPLAARSLVLLELTSWTLDDSGPGATTSLVLRAGMLPTRARPVDWNREVGLPDGSVVIARGRPLPTWSPAEISMGDLITFLADAPRSQLDSPLVYEIQPDFEEVIRRALRATPPMQGVTVVLHGFWEGRAIRRRAFSTWRPVLEDVRQLAQSIAESFTDLAPRPFHLVAARVPEQFFREDGSLEVVVFVIFDRPSSARPVLLRQLEGGYLVRDILLLVEHQTSISSMLQQAEWAASDIEASWFHAAQPQPWVDIMEVLVPAHGDVFDVVLGLLSDDAADEAPSLLQFDARLFSSFSLVEDFKAAAPIDSAPALQPLSLEELLPQLGKREGISFEDVSCFCSELYTMPAVPCFVLPDHLQWHSASRSWNSAPWWAFDMAKWALLWWPMCVLALAGSLVASLRFILHLSMTLPARTWLSFLL